MLRENLGKIKHLFLYSEIHSELFSNWAFSNRDITKVIENIEHAFALVAEYYSESRTALKSHFNRYLRGEIEADAYIEDVIALLMDDKLPCFLKVQDKFIHNLKAKLPTAFQDPFLQGYTSTLVAQQTEAAPTSERPDSPRVIKAGDDTATIATKTAPKIEQPALPIVAIPSCDSATSTIKILEATTSRATTQRKAAPQTAKKQTGISRQEAEKPKRPDTYPTDTPKVAARRHSAPQLSRHWATLIELVEVSSVDASYAKRSTKKESASTSTAKIKKPS